MFLNLNVMGQGITQNNSEGTTPHFEDANKNIDLHLKFGRFLFKEKVIVGLGFNFRSVNDSRVVRGEDSEFEHEYFKRAEYQLGFFTRYNVYKGLFSEGYIGFLGWGYDYIILPEQPIGPIIKYKIGLGYTFNIWHFLAIEPNIGFMNARKLYRGSGYALDDVGKVSIGLGLAFKL